MAVLNYCQHILCRNNYLYLSFAFVNNKVHTTALHWTQIIAINAASKNTDHSLLILLWSFSVKKISSFYFCKIIGPPISLWNFYIKKKKFHSIFESNQLSKSLPVVFNPLCSLNLAQILHQHSNTLYIRFLSVKEHAYTWANLFQCLFFYRLFQ